MTEAITDQLLQAAATRPESVFAVTGHGRNGHFSDHLRKVESPTRTTAKPNQPNKSDEPRTVRDTEPAKPAVIAKRVDVKSMAPKSVKSEPDTAANLAVDASSANVIELDPIIPGQDQASYEASMLAATGDAIPMNHAAGDVPIAATDQAHHVIKAAASAAVVTDAVPISHDAAPLAPQNAEAQPLAPQNAEVLTTLHNSVETVEPLEVAVEHELVAAADGEAEVATDVKPPASGDAPNTPDEVLVEHSKNAGNLPVQVTTAAQQSVTPIAGQQSDQAALKPVNPGRSQPSPAHDEAGDRVVQATDTTKESDADRPPSQEGQHVTEKSVEPFTSQEHRQGAIAPEASILPAEPIETVTIQESNGEATEASAKVENARTDSVLNSLTRLQRQTTARAERGGENEPPRVDADRFVNRVAKAFDAAQDRQGPLQLRLSPPELGSLRLELTIKDGALTAALETESPAAKRVLLEHLPALRDRLAEQNIRIERFDVDVRRDGGGQQDAGPYDQRQQQQEMDDASGRRPTSRPAAAAQQEAAEQRLVHALQNTDAGLNLIV